MLNFFFCQYIMYCILCIYNIGQPVSQVSIPLREHFRNNVAERCHVAVIPEDSQRIFVLCKHIWSDAKRALRLPSFNDSIGLNVSFIGEDALDAGGPLCEFFCLVLQKVN